MFLVWVDDDDDFLAVVAAYAQRWTGDDKLVVTTDVLAPELDQADAWIVDLSMADLDGLSLVERASERGVPVAVVSSLAAPFMARQARDLGACAVWDKGELLRYWPERPEELLQPS